MDYSSLKCIHIFMTLFGSPQGAFVKTAFKPISSSLCRHIIHKQPGNVLHLLMASSSHGPTGNDLKPVESVTSGSAAVATLKLPDSKTTTGDEEKNSTDIVTTASSTEG